ncbi:receptor-type tyrosine-protein phosphatase eta-like [Diadema antillarum]|uniref:receptor-type tyrosine-protein phosphatase eta-like n=1 Tax=Diadema antillarum TaxID=105358 RepID=UPI003A8A9E4A
MPGTLYTVSVSVVGTNEQGSASALTRPSSPIDLSVDSISQSIATVSWSAGSGEVDTYEIYLTENSGEPTLVATNSRNEVTETLDTLSPQTAYTISVVSVVTAGDLRETSEAATVDFTTEPAVITAIEDGTALNVSWNSVNRDIINYQLAYSSSETGATSRYLFVNPGQGVISGRIEDLTLGQKYTLVLAAVEMAGDRSELGSRTYTLKPATPTISVLAGTESPNAVSLAVQLVNGILSSLAFLLFPQASGLGTGTPIDTEVTVPVDACPEIELSGLIPDTDYIVRVTAQSGVASSDPVVLIFTTPPTTMQGELSFGDITTSGFTVYWPPFGSESYRLTIGGATVVVPRTADPVQSYTVTGLSSATQVSVSLMDGGSGQITTRPNPPGEPTALPSDTSIDLTWTASPDVNSYEVCYTPQDGSASPSLIVGTSHTITDLNPETTYLISISASGSGKSEKRTISVTTTEDTAIPVATNFRVTDTRASDREITLEWNLPASDSFDRFQLSYNPTSGSPASPVLIPKDVSSLVLSNVLADVPYDFSLVSVRGAESSSALDIADVEIVVGSIDATIGERTSTSLEVLWGQPQGTVNGYTVNVGGTAVILPADSRSRVFDNLDPGTEYTVIVQANGAGVVPSEDTVTARTLYATEALVAQVVDQGPTGVRLSLAPPFEDPAQYDGYNIRVFLSNNIRVFLSSNSPVLQTIPVPKTACPELWIYGLYPDTQYSIEVAWTLGMETSEPTAVTARTVAAAPLQISVESLETESMTVTWQEGSGSFSNYLVSYSPNGPTPVLVARGEPRTATFTGLQSGTEYTIMVQQQGETSDSEQIMQYTKPQPVNTLELTALKDSLDISWQSPNGGSFDAYRVCHYPRGDRASPLDNGLTRSITLDGLDSQTQYLVSVYSSSGQVLSTGVTMDEETLIGDPGDIRVAPSDVETNSILITWIVIPEITSYTVGYTNADGTGGEEVPSQNSAEYTFSGLDPGTEYIFYVVPEGRNRQQRSQFTRPEPPVELTFDTITTDEISISWLRPANGGVDRYRIDYTPGGGVPPSGHIVDHQDGLTAQTLTVAGLTAMTEYTFSIYSLIGDENLASTTALSQDTGTTINLMISAVTTSTSFTVLWDVLPPGDFNQYLISFSPDHNDRPGSQRSPQVISVSSLGDDAQGSLLIYGLSPGELYTVNLKTRLNGVDTDDGIGRISYRTAPLPVGDVSVTTTETTVALDWADVDPVLYGYVIEQTPMEGSTPSPVTASQVTASSLAPGKEYVFNIYTVSGYPDNYETRSDPQTVVAYTNPRSPQNLVVSDVRDDEFTLTWSPPVEVNYPIAYFLLDLIPDEPFFPLRINSTRQEWEIHDGLTSGREYRVELRSVLEATTGSLIESTPAESDIFLLAPRPPSGLSTPYVTTNETRVEWTLSNTDYTGFRVSYGEDVSQNVISATPVEPFILLTNLSPATVYSFSVTTVSRGTENPSLVKTSATSLTTTVSTKSAVPQDLEPSAVTSTTITVVWVAPDNDVSQYHIVAKDEAGNDVSDTLIPGDQTSYTVEGLTPFSQYTITVAARFNGQDSDTVERTQRTFPGMKIVFDTFPAPSQVVNPQASVTSPNSVQLSWSPPVSANGILEAYIIQVLGTSLSSGDNTDVMRTYSYPSTRLGETITGLPTGFSYTFAISVNNSVATSDPVVAGPVQLPHSAPPSPLSSALVRHVSSSGSTVRVSFDTSFFSEEYGPVARYAILVAESNEDNTPQSPVDPPPSWQSRDGVNTFGYAYQATPSDYQPFDTNTRALYTVGSNNSCTIESTGYCNGPLSPITLYRFAIRAYGSDGKYTDTQWSPPYSTASDTVWFVIPVIVLIVITLVLLLIMLLIWRECCGPAGTAMYESRNGQAMPLVEASYPSDRSVPPIPFKAPLPDDTPSFSALESSHSVRTNPYASIRPNRPQPPPVVEDPVRPSSSTLHLTKPVQIKKFPEHVRQLSADNNAGFADEYHSLGNIGKDKSTDKARLPVNTSKNRYRNILPFDDTAVHLQDLEEGQTSDYINANYLSGAYSNKDYIATQGPVPDSVNDFWEMVFENKSTTIVMITGLVEGGKTKCEHYWPDDEGPVNYGSVIVTMVNQQEMDHWVVRSFVLEKGNRQLETTHYAFKGWVDHDVPSTPRPMIDFIRTIQMAHDRSMGPMTVHCSAGIGRTGVFIALDQLITVVDTSKPSGTIDVYGTVARMRQQRFSMVQTVKQYMFIHTSLLPLVRQ